MKKDKNRYIDLSDIKSEELEQTASFTDLMSREELKKRKRKKEEEKTRELKEILMNDDDKKELKKEEKRKRKLAKKLAKDEKKFENATIKDVYEKKKDNDIEENEDLTKTQKLLDLTNEIKVSMLNNVNENIKEEKKKFGIGTIVISDLFIIISLAFYIYSILFTNYQNNELYLLIGGLIILAMIMFFCISIISSKIVSRVFSIFNYIIFITYVLFNLVLVLGIITL